jgi:hypothetical protein
MKPAKSRPREVVARGTVVALLCTAVPCCHPPPPQPVDTFADRWMILPDPRGDSLVGMSFNFGAAPREGCYRVVRVVRAPSTSSVAASWNVDRGDTANLKVADILGLGYQARFSARGSILFEDLEIATATGISPVTSNSCADRKDFLPRHPGVTEVLGARKMKYIAYRSDGTALRLPEVKGSVVGRTANAVVTVQGRSDDSSELSFDGLRWIGVHMQRWSYTQVRDTMWKEMIRRARISRSPRYNVDLEYDTMPGDAYKVFMRVNMPNAKRDSVEVRENESFFIGADTLVAGDYIQGWIEAANANRSVATITLITKKLRPVYFNRERDREQLATSP